MRKAFIIFIQIVVLILFLRTEFAQHFFGGIATTIVSWYQNVVELPERSKIIVLRDKFLRNNMILRPHQVDYVIQVTDSAEEIERFHRLYCINKDKNPYIFGDTLDKLCSDIEDSELLP
jgi:hypothetical protein